MCLYQKQALTLIWKILHGRLGIRILSSSAESISHSFAAPTREHSKIKFVSPHGHVISSISFTHNSFVLFRFSFPLLQLYLHEINVLEQNIQKYESSQSSAGPLDALKTLYCTKHTIARYVSTLRAGLHF